MVREIGLWKDIIWEKEAACRVFEYCGGHPLVTRYFASYASHKGALKQIDCARVSQTAEEIQKTLRKNEIGNYYKEAIADLLLPEEQEVLKLISQSDNKFPEKELPSHLEDALTSLENFGLVNNLNGCLQLTAELFRLWLENRVKH